MKKVIVKRLIYRDGNGKEIIGNTEYNGSLTDDNILNAVHEVGRTQWIGQSLWLMKSGRPIYHITVAPFTQYQKRWYENLFDTVRKI